MFQSRQIKTKLPDERKPPKNNERDERRALEADGTWAWEHYKRAGNWLLKTQTHNMDGYMLTTIGGGEGHVKFLSVHQYACWCFVLVTRESVVIWWVHA